jgi:hypothetical protein
MCPTTRIWQTSFISHWFPNSNLTENEEKYLWLFGTLEGEQGINEYVFYMIMCFQQKIWECKLSNKTPSFQTITNSFKEEFDEVLRNSKVVRVSHAKINPRFRRVDGHDGRAAVAGPVQRQGRGGGGGGGGREND